MFAGNLNLFAIICAVLFITIIIITLIVVLGVNRHSAKYYTNEDKRGRLYSPAISISTHSKPQTVQSAGGMYEKNIDTLSITGNEMNYKFPIDDIIYTIEEVSLQPPTQPPLISSFTTRNG